MISNSSFGGKDWSQRQYCKLIQWQQYDDDDGDDDDTSPPPPPHLSQASFDAAVAEAVTAALAAQPPAQPPAQPLAYATAPATTPRHDFGIRCMMDRMVKGTRLFDRTLSGAQLLTIYAKVSGTARRVTEMQINQIAEFAVTKNILRRMEEFVRGMSYAPACRISTRGTRGRLANLPAPPPVGNRFNVGPPAILSRNPRTLECLWYEYVNGIGGANPARDFNRGISIEWREGDSSSNTLED